MVSLSKMQVLIASAILSFIVPVCLVFASGSGITISGDTDFKGSLAILGALSKGSGTFVIDHPLKPLTHLLYHSFVESPQALNMYQGEVVLNSLGEARVTLPSYFEALNTDFEYYLEPIGTPMPKLFVKEEIKLNSFTIAGGVPGKKVSWHVSGVRHDPYILANPIIPEVWKTDATPVVRGECLFEELCK